MSNSPNDHSPRGQSNHRFSTQGGTPSDDLRDLTVIADWRRVPFLMVDSAPTKLHEDAVAVKGGASSSHWSADLKIIHPLPLQGPVSLKEGEEQICLGIRDIVDSQGGRHPSVSLVRARNVIKFTDGQAAALLDGRERTVTGIRGQDVSGPNLFQRLKDQLTLVRATALHISASKNQQLRPEHSMAILATHAQTVTIKASRRLRECPSLVVLRHEVSRVVTEAESRKQGLNFPSQTGLVTVAGGKAVPTLLRGGEPANRHDSLRLKERGNSGAINITQIACALLGIAPIPENLVQEGLRSDSDLDRWKHGGPLPVALSIAITERRNAISEILNQLM